ncbi:MAG: flagellar protein FlgN [Nitrospiraceae bacterium]|nr:flagellar protein FlgN [Nitrospiraceae bacterium]
MDATPEKIKEILEQQVGQYKELLELLQKERLCLMDLDWEGVRELSKRKDTVVLKLRLLEQERVRLVEGLPISGGCAGEGLLSLRELEAKTGDAAFLTLRSQLICLLQSISELNEFNRILIDRTLVVVNGSLETLGLGGHAAGGHAPKGFLPGKGMAVSRNI